MALPKFTSIRSQGAEHDAAQHREKPVDVVDNDVEGGVVANELSSERTLTPTYTPGVDLKRATRRRKMTVWVSSFFFFASVVFLILTEIGSTYNKPFLRNTYLFSLNMSQIFPTSTPNLALINSITRSIGLHDFYNVGLWGFCEGYQNEGVTFCSDPEAMYAFNPVEILLDELFAGASIALPTEINTILNIVQVVSYLMFAFFMSGACINFVSIFLAPLALYSRWWSLPLTIFTLIGALLTTAATIIGTVYALIFRSALTSQEDLNIIATLGVQMFGFMWAATACSLAGFFIQLSLGCCCASRRDVRTGRRKGNLKAYGHVPASEEKKVREGRSRRFLLFGR